MHFKSVSPLCGKLLKLLNGEKMDCSELFVGGFFCNLATNCGGELLWQPQDGLLSHVILFGHGTLDGVYVLRAKH